MSTRVLPSTIDAIPHTIEWRGNSVADIIKAVVLGSQAQWQPPSWGWAFGNPDLEPTGYAQRWNRVLELVACSDGDGPDAASCAATARLMLRHAARTDADTISLGEFRIVPDSKIVAALEVNPYNQFGYRRARGGAAFRGHSFKRLGIHQPRLLLAIVAFDEETDHMLATEALAGLHAA